MYIERQESMNIDTSPEPPHGGASSLRCDDRSGRRS